MARGVFRRRGNQINSNNKKGGLLAAAVAGVLAPGAIYVQPAHAATFTWDETRSGNWSTPTNWLEGIAPTGSDTTDQLIFGGSGTAYTSTVDPVQNLWLINGLTLSSSATVANTINNTNAAGFQLSGLNPFITQNSSGAFTISSAIGLGGATTLSGSGTGLTTLSGVISGANQLVVNSGTWRVTNAANSWTGGTSITGGVLELFSNNADLAAGAAGNTRLGNGGIVNINAATPGGQAELRFTSGAGRTMAGASSKQIVFGANGGLVNIDGGFAAANFLNITTSTAVGASPAVIRFNGGPNGLSTNNAASSDWTNGNNALRLAVTNAGPIRVELLNGAMLVSPNVATLNSPLTVRGVFGGEPSSGPNGTLHTGIARAIGRFDVPNQARYTYAGGLFFEDALQVAPEGAARSLEGTITIRGTASGHPGNVTFFGRSTGTALVNVDLLSPLQNPGQNAAGLNPLYIGFGNDDNLIIEDGGIATLDLRIRSDQNNHNGVLLNAATRIQAGGKLIFRQSISAQTPGLTPAPTQAPVGFHIVQGNITGEGTSSKESVIDLYMPGDNTVGDGAFTGGVDWQSTSNLIVNGTGTGGLRINGLTRPNALFGGGSNTDPDANNAKVEAFLTPQRLATLTGSGGYLTAAPRDSTFTLKPGSDWAPGVTVGLKVVDSHTNGDDVFMEAAAPTEPPHRFTHNVLIDAGATLNANSQTLGPAVVTEGIGRIWGTGTIKANATIDAGGRLAPGVTIGTMNSIGDITLNGALEVEITDPAHDLLAIQGSLHLSPSSILDLPLSNAYGYSPYTIVTTTNGVNGTFGSAVGLPGSYEVDYSGGMVRLLFAAADQKVWSGTDGVNPTFWDDNVSTNFTLAGAPARYIDANHDDVTFDDTATGTTNVSVRGNLLPSSVTVNNNSRDYTITSTAGNAIGGTTGLDKRGSGKLTLSGPNTFNGPIFIHSGTVSVNQLADAGVASPLGVTSSIKLGDLSAGIGTIQYTGSSDGSTNRSIVVEGPGGGFDVVNSGVNATFSGVVSGDGSVTKRGAGIATLSNTANTFTGGINVEQGTLRLASMGPGLAPVTLGLGANAGTLDYTGATFSDPRGINFGGPGTIRISNAATNLTLGGAVNGPTLGKTGPGTLTLTGQVSLSNDAHTVSEGTLSLTNSGNSIPTGSNITVPGGATLQARGGSIGGANVRLTGGTFRISADNSGLFGQFYQTAFGMITADNTGANAGGSSVFNSPGNFNAFLVAQNLIPSATANTSATGTNIAFPANNAGGGNPLAPWNQNIGNDFIVGRWTGKINIPTTGLYTFNTASDDGSVLFIDGVKVVDFNRLGGYAESPAGTVNLSAGVHEIMIGWYENAGSAGIDVRWTPPGGVKEQLPNNILLASTPNASTSFVNNNIVVTSDSTIDNANTNNALFANLNISPLTLTHSGVGATRFVDTTLTGAASSAYNFNVTGGILDLGQVNSGGLARVINKSGSGNLVLGTSGGAGLAAGSSVNISGGNLVVVGDGTSGSVLGTAPVVLNAGATGLQFSRKSTTEPNPALFVDTPITVNENARIAFLATDGGMFGPIATTLASPITVTGDKTVTLSTDDGYSLSLASAISGSGGITVASGDGPIDFATSQSTGTLAVNSGTVNFSTPQTATVATTVGGFPAGNYATAHGNAVLTSPSLTLGNRGTWNANVPSGLPASITANAGSILNANVVNSLNGAAVSASGGNVQFFVDNAIGSGSVTLSANGSITGRVQDVGSEPVLVRTLPAFSIAAGQAGNLVADRDGDAGAFAGRVIAPTANLGAGSTMNFLANNNTTLHAASINLGGGTATLVNNASDTRVTVGNINGGTTALTLAGARHTRLLGNITASNVVVSGGGLDVDPGASATSQVAAPVQVNTVLNALTGTTDMGSNVITGDPTRSVPGLSVRFYQLAANPAAANFNTLAALNAFYTDTAPVAPFVTTTTAGGKTDMNYGFPGTGGFPFTELGFNGTIQFAGVFRGQIFLPPSGSNTLFTRSDDGSVLFLAGGNNPLVNNNGDHGAATQQGTTTLSGWQDVVIGYYQAGGGLGFTTSIGADGTFVTNSMLRRLDPTGAFGGTINVESGAELRAGGISTVGTVNFNGATGAAILSLANTTPHSGTVSFVNVNGTAVMSLGANNVLVAENLSVPDSATFDKDGDGTLRVSTSHNFGSGSTIAVNGGRLLLNSAGTGTGAIIVRSGGTLGGRGSAPGTATITSGGHIAPGDGIGTLTLGGLSLEGGALLDFEGAAAGFDLINVTDFNGFLLPSSGTAAVNVANLGGLGSGDYVLIDYTGNPLLDGDVTSKLVIGQMPGFTGSIFHDSASTQVKLHLEADPVGPPQWNVDASGNWGDAANWQGGIPSGDSAVANFLGKITAPRTVTLDGGRTVGTLNFDNANKYTIASGGSNLTVGNGITGTIDVASGSHEISASFSVHGSVSKTGPGTLTISGAQSHFAGAALNISKGQLNLNSNAGSTGNGALALRLTGNAQGDSSKIVVGANQDLKELVVASADSGTQTLDLASPAAAGAFNSITVYSSDLAGAKAALWNAIVNANAAGAANSQDGIIDSGLHAGAGVGIAMTPGSHVLIRPTRLGDTNLDGTVSISDFLDLASNFNSIGTATWQEGDMNYDRSVTISDFLDLASNFNSSYTGSVGAISEEDHTLLANFASSIGADPGVIGSAVPEPATLSLLAAGAMGLMARRRRRA